MTAEFTVSSAGDVNDDGISDIIVGVSASFSGKNTSLGGAYVVFGSEEGFEPSVNLSELDGENGFVINNIDSSKITDVSVSAAGDLNGDGIDDVIVGNPAADRNGDGSGASYVIFGTEDGFDESVDVTALDGENGFALFGEEKFEFAGAAVSSAGDVNGDGIDDVIIGASGDADLLDEAGRSYVVFGSTDGFNAELELSSLDGTNGFVIEGVDLEDSAGTAVDGIGDLNGDGVSDIAIGAPGSGLTEGATYVVYGGSEVGADGTVELSDVTNGTDGFVITGIDFGDLSGASVSILGDVNDDGLTDVFIGAPGVSSGGFFGLFAGSAYVVFGPENGFEGEIDLQSLDAGEGFVLRGDELLGAVGTSVDSSGDFNGDGVFDLIVGAPGADDEEGRTYVVFGGEDVGASGEVDLSSLDGENGFEITGVNENNNTGRSVSNAGDVNNDGIDDLLIGGALGDTVDDDAGAAYVVFGSDEGFDAELSVADLDGANGFVLDATSAENLFVA